MAAVLAGAEETFGEPFSRILTKSRVWVNGEEAGPATRVNDEDEVAVIPPVSGG